jgi:cyclopropane fatty-acyl-phospholipid synthase-like methyltransferase
VNYILKNHQEPERLDEQSQAEEFSLERELAKLDFRKINKVLDAGCGSGVLCRYLEEKHPHLHLYGCDISQSSLEHCRENSRKTDTTYFEHNFVNASVADKFDLIVSRLVFHHLSLSQQKIGLKNLRSSLSDEGQICLIDVDGLFLNLGTSSEKLLEQMEMARSRFGGNVVSARYFPAFLKDLGFREVSWRVETLDFQGEARLREVAQWKQRFESSLEFYVSVFGSEFEARKFLKLYLEEAARPETTLFYNKFIVTGKK